MPIVLTKSWYKLKRQVICLLNHNSKFSGGVRPRSVCFSEQKFIYEKKPALRRYLKICRNGLKLEAKHLKTEKQLSI